MSFPGGDFIIRNRANRRVLDDRDMSTKPGNPIIDYDYKDHNNDNQRWVYKKDRRLYNKYSGLALTFKDLTPESTATQEKNIDHCEGQMFEYKDGIISVVGHDDRVVGAWDYDVKIVRPDPYDKARRWDFN